MFSQPFSSLVSVSSSGRRDFSEIAIGDLVTVNVYNPNTGAFDLQIGGRVKRIDAFNVWISVTGLNDTRPYQVGDNLVVDRDKVIDW